MKFKYVTSSQGRKKFSDFLRIVDENGDIIVFTTHGKAKAALVDIELLEEFIENVEYGMSEKDILSRLDEKTVSLDELKKELDV